MSTATEDVTIVTEPDQRTLLARPFRPELIQSRRIAGRQVSYVPVGAVIERLNRACPEWDYRIVRTGWETMRLNRKGAATEVQVFTVVGELEIAGLGSRQAIGVQALDDGSGEDLLKGAASDALKKAATLFGVPVDGQLGGNEHEHDMDRQGYRRKH